MVFKSAISQFNKYMYIGIILLLLALTTPAFFEGSYEPLFAIVIIDIVLISFFIWTYKTTYYQLKESTLIWKSGPFYGKIALDSISKIAHHNGIIVPTFWKPALSHIGLIITYNKFDDIYISPENSAEFIAQLLKTNPNITIKN
jgi:Bacterial PH domain